LKLQGLGFFDQIGFYAWQNIDASEHGGSCLDRDDLGPSSMTSRTETLYDRVKFEVFQIAGIRGIIHGLGLFAVALEWRILSRNPMHHFSI
jgi:hypothetical protein